MTLKTSSPQPNPKFITFITTLGIIIGLITAIFIVIWLILVFPEGNHNIQYVNPFALALISSIISLFGSFISIILAIILVLIFIVTSIRTPAIAKANFLRFFLTISLCLLPPFFFFSLV